MAMDKRTFKICEAVHLGLDYYYMGPHKKTMLTDKDVEVAKRILPTLPDKWWLTKHSWDACRW